jgi:hypothetical protein
VHLPDETLVSTNLGSSIRSALTQKHQATTQYAGPGSPHNGDFNKPAVTENDIHVTWEEDEAEDDTWI